MNKKAEMGIGTLIIFIALLLVAAIAAGVLIQTSSSLQEKSLSTGQQAQSQIATNIKVIEVSATDGSTSHLNDFTQIVKLAPGSGDIKVNDVLLTMNTFDKSASLTYRGVNGTFDNNNLGYNTWNLEEIKNNSGSGVLNVSYHSNHTLLEDYDNDGLDDVFAVTQTGRIAIYYSSGGNYTVPSATATCAGASHSVSVTDTVDNDYIYSILFSGTCGNNYFLSSNLSVNITPTNLGEGYFTMEYLQRGSNPVAGNLQRGDVVKIYYEAPKSVGEDEKIRINFIPKAGTPTLTEFITPEVISNERVYLYP